MFGDCTEGMLGPNRHSQTKKQGNHSTCTWCIHMLRGAHTRAPARLSCNPVSPRTIFFGGGLQDSSSKRSQNPIQHSAHKHFQCFTLKKKKALWFGQQTWLLCGPGMQGPISGGHTSAPQTPLLQCLVFNQCCNVAWQKSNQAFKEGGSGILRGVKAPVACVRGTCVSLLAPGSSRSAIHSQTRRSSPEGLPVSWMGYWASG